MSIFIEHFLELPFLITELIVLFFICILFIYFSRKSLRKDFYLMFFIALVFKFIFFVGINISLYTLSDSFAFEDDNTYYMVSQKVVDSWKKGNHIAAEKINYKAAKNPGYYYVSALIMTIFGDNYYTTRLFNLFLSIIIGFFIYLIALKIYTRKEALISSFIFLLLPDLCFWSSTQFKDIITLLLTIMIFYYLFYSDKKRGILLAILFLIPLSFIRFESVLLIAFTFFILQIKFSYKSIASIILFISLAIGFLYWKQDLFSSGLVVGLGKEAATFFDFRTLLNYNKKLESSGLISYAYMFSVYDLWKLPFSIFIILFTPFPPWLFQDNIAVSLLSFLSIPWLILVPYIFFGFISSSFQFFFRSEKTQRVKPILIFSILYLVSLAIFLFTFSPLRHRIEIVPFLLLLSVPLINKRKKFLKWLMIGSLNFVIIGVIYAFFKM